MDSISLCFDDLLNSTIKDQNQKGLYQIETSDSHTTIKSLGTNVDVAVIDLHPKNGSVVVRGRPIKMHKDGLFTSYAVKSVTKLSKLTLVPVVNGLRKR